MNTSLDMIRQMQKTAYQRPDIYLIRKWYHYGQTPSISPSQSNPEAPDPILSDTKDEIRHTAYLNFYKQIKSFKVASRQTIQRWFGIGGFAVPSRRQLLSCALFLHISLEETQDYLLHYLSQWDLQVNDYEEMICMYCLENQLGYDSFEFMVHFFETHTDQELRPLQTAQTDLLKKTYKKKKSLPQQEFLLWMCQSAELFKGYSMTVYSYYIHLLNEAFQYYQKECLGELQMLLTRTDYEDWKTSNANSLSHMNTEKERIRRYLKNMQRRKSPSASPEDLKEIQNLYVIAYAPKARISDLLNQIYHNNKKDSATWNHEMFAQLSDFLGEEMQWENSKYISELLSMSVQKERQMLYQRARAALELSDPEKPCPGWICRLLNGNYPDQKSLSVKDARKTITKELKKQKTRVRNIQRSDLLLLIQYIYSVKYDSETQQNLTGYRKEDAIDGFVTLSNTILTTCGMRGINPSYRLDQLLLSCITDEEIILLGNLLDTSFDEEEVPSNHSC